MIVTQEDGMRSMVGRSPKRIGAAPPIRRAALMTHSSLELHLALDLVLLAELPILTTTTATQEGGTRTMAGQWENRRGAAPTNRKVVQMTPLPLVSDQVQELFQFRLRAQCLSLLTPTTTTATQEGGMRTTAGQMGRRTGAAPPIRRVAQVTKSTQVRAELFSLSF